MKRLHSNGQGKEEEQVEVQFDVISLLKEYLDNPDPEKLVDFTKIIFSILFAYQKKHPEKEIVANDIPKIFEGIIVALLSLYEESEEKIPEDIYKLLLGMSSYLSGALDVNGFAAPEGIGSQSLLGEFGKSFKAQAESAFKENFTKNRYEVNPNAKLAADQQIENLVYVNFKKVFDFVNLLYFKVREKSIEQLEIKHAGSFKEAVFNSIKRALDIKKDCEASQESVSSDKKLPDNVTLTEANPISLLDEFLSDNNSENIVDLTMMIFSILWEKQKEYPEKELGRDSVREIFSNKAKNFLQAYMESKKEFPVKIYKFLLFMESYVYAVKEDYATCTEGEKRDFARRIEALFKEAISGGNQVQNKESDVQKQVNRYFMKVWRFLTALREGIENAFSEEIISEHEANFKNGFSDGVSKGSKIQKEYNLCLATTQTSKRISSFTTRSVKRDIPKKHPQSRWKKFKASWKALPLKWKILTGIAIALEGAAVVVCTIVFPPSALITVPGGAAITTTAVISAAGAVSIAGTATAHAVHISNTKPAAVMSDDIPLEAEAAASRTRSALKATEEEKFIRPGSGAGAGEGGAPAAVISVPMSGSRNSLFCAASNQDSSKFTEEEGKAEVEAAPAL